MREWDPLGAARYHTAPTVGQPAPPSPSGLFLYTVRGDVIDDGELVVLDEAPATP
jgi:hypothetical protein